MAGRREAKYARAHSYTRGLQLVVRGESLRALRTSEAPEDETQGVYRLSHAI